MSVARGIGLGLPIHSSCLIFREKVLASSLHTRLGRTSINGANDILSGIPGASSVLELLGEPLEAFRTMCREEFPSSLVELKELIQNCSDKKDLLTARRLYSHIISQGLDSVVGIHHHLIGMFASCRSLHDAIIIFNSARDCKLWDAIIMAHLVAGENRQALALYKKMLQDGMEPSQLSFACVLKGCGALESVEEGKLVHGEIRRHGFQSDAVVGSAIVSMYAKCGCVQEALKAFNEVERQNVVVWGALIDGYAGHGEGYVALDLYKKMQKDGLSPNKIILLSVLKACSCVRAIEDGREVHSKIICYGSEPDAVLGNSLVDMYTKCKVFEDACEVFHGLSSKSSVSWNALLVGLVQHGHGVLALEMFSVMQKEGFMPSMVTYSCVVKACGLTGMIKEGAILHHGVLTDFALPDIGIQNCLIDMYSKLGCVEDAQKVFDCVENQDIVSCGAMIAGYTTCKKSQSAFELFTQLQDQGIRPNKTMFLLLLKASGSAKARNEGWLTHKHLIVNGFELDAIIVSALIDMYAKCGSMEEAHLVFSQLPNRDVVSWSTILGGYVQNGADQCALELFGQMDIEADEVTFSIIIKSCGNIGAMGFGKAIHEQIIQSGYESNVIVGSTLIDMYAKCGDVLEASKVFDSLQNRNVFSWCAMITGYAHHGHHAQALQCLEALHGQGMKPEGSIYTGILAALGHAGEVVQGQAYFEHMTGKHGINPQIYHFSCVIDLLGRAGQFDDAKKLIKEIPMLPDTTIWMSMLNACRKFGHVPLAQQCFGQLVCLEPENASFYAIMSSIYAEAGMWEDVEKLKSRLYHANVWKKPGKAWIEVKKKLHEFVVGDETHCRITGIRKKLRRLALAIKHMGYVPDSDLILDNISDKEKEERLLGHCERLAIAFGLLSTPAGTTIRVTKNLRVCSDCHNATKLISKVEKREIIVVDAHRVHRFVDGSCSCDDYF